MAKVLKVNISKTTIGLNNGEIIEVETSSLNFIPKENDEVEVFKSENETIVNKVEPKITQNIVNVYGQKPVNKMTYALLAIF